MRKNRERTNINRKPGNRPRQMNKKPQGTGKRFNLLMQKKLVVLYGTVLLAFALLGVRLYLITRDNGDSYKKQVLSQQEYDSTDLPFKRGDIVDAKGSKLAYSEKVYNVIIDSKAMHSGKEEEYLQPTLAAVRKFFPQIDMAELEKYVNDNPTSQYKIFAKKLSYDEISPYVEYEALAKESEELEQIKGVWFEEDYKRSYPYGSLACDVLGFTQGENEGYFGLEEYYNSTLNGTPGREYGYLTEDSTLERSIKPATDGNTIVTTIDTNVQSIVEKKIKEFNEEYRNNYRDGYGADNIGVIVMNPNNGEILAMASYPDFDLNNPRDLTPFYDAATINGMDDDEKLEALNQIWRNFCISDSYEPGSTMKPFTVAGALENGSITGDESYNCTGLIELGGFKIHCHNRLGDGLLTVQQGVQKSCNVVLMNIALKMGKEDWLKYNRLFNFGLKTNVDLAGEVNCSSLVFNEKMGRTDLAVGSFGQGFNVTMIQMAAGFSSLINGGYYYQPHFVSKILNSEGATVDEIEPRILKQTVSNTTSERVREMCRSVVMEGTEGTGYTARPAGYTMGGKTGTAEKIPRALKNYLVSFMGYVPAENPEILCYCVIDRPNVGAQDNARLATVLCHDIMTEVLPYENIFMTEPLTEEELAELSEQQLDFANGSDVLPKPEVLLDEDGNPIEQPEGEEAVNEDDENAADSENRPENEGGPEEEGVNVIQYDPETGFPIDPNTGEVLDPQTLLPINGGGSFMDAITPENNTENTQ